jgi:hypothetical protein
VSGWILLKVDVIEVRNIRSIGEYFIDLLVQGNRLSDLGNAVLDVDVFDMQHVD